MTKDLTKNDLDFNRHHDFAMPEVSVTKSKPGINKNVVQSISDYKKEESWMQQFRQASYKIFNEKEMPTWGPDLSKINFDNITYFLGLPTSKLPHGMTCPMK